ncbi:hypothetical protein EDC01DRAFT_30800 [Geopyxis carbonaria]|nr:hypothetical protein EDC01DRAFT_30800 [Geopyxis carbonaria]
MPGMFKSHVYSHLDGSHSFCRILYDVCVQDGPSPGPRVLLKLMCSVRLLSRRRRAQYLVMYSILLVARTCSEVVTTYVSNPLQHRARDHPMPAATVHDGTCPPHPHHPYLNSAAPQLRNSATPQRHDSPTRPTSKAVSEIIRTFGYTDVRPLAGQSQRSRRSRRSRRVMVFRMLAVGARIGARMGLGLGFGLGFGGAQVELVRGVAGLITSVVAGDLVWTPTVPKHFTARMWLWGGTSPAQTGISDVDRTSDVYGMEEAAAVGGVRVIHSCE